MVRPEVITSAANPLLKDVRRAMDRGALTEQGLAVAGTFHLLEEALRSAREVPVVLTAESVSSTATRAVRGLPGVRIAILPDALFERLSSTESNQGVIALVRPPIWTLEQLFRGLALVVVLDGVQDPGNCGAIVRSAEAFGATGVLMTKGTASPHNPKTLRAAAGSLFRVPYVHGMDALMARAALRQQRIAVLAASAHAPGNRTLAAAGLTGKCAIVIGSEGRGISEPLRAGARLISIPTSGVESLNAAVAAGVLLYEARRQRSLQP
jgi:TrmH family RNA methyltransferase